MNNAAIVKHTGLTHFNSGAELGRLVLSDDVEGNGETFFLSRAFKLLRQEKPEIISILSYADPLRRIGPAGDVIMPGHVGRAYQRSEEHTSDLQSLMSISYAVFCLQKNTHPHAALHKSHTLPYTHM